MDRVLVVREGGTVGILFGTDGARGVANRELTPELAFALGRAAAYVLAEQRRGHRPAVLVGRDTRISGDMLQAALAAGLMSAGVDVKALGVIPTPGVAFLTRELRADAGAVISASHNPVEDNGIKFFGPDGFKLPDETEEQIEACLTKEAGEWRAAVPDLRPVGGGVGCMLNEERLQRSYLEHVVSTSGDLDLGGMQVVVDCANGAASRLAPEILERVGAEVVVTSTSPNGVNINVKCGSTHPEAAARAVVAEGAALGLMFDGDADRCLAVDEKGRVVDGDQIMAICAQRMKRSGTLKGGAVAATVYSNLGLRDALQRMGVELIVTKNGDRYVLEAMRARGLALGGEQSGHIVFLDHNTTGDGLITALQLLSALQESGRPLSELSRVVEKYPQLLVNVRVKDKGQLEKNERVRRVIAEVEEELGPEGRVLVRASGTEPVIRIMGEAQEEQAVRRAVEKVQEVITSELG